MAQLLEIGRGANASSPGPTAKTRLSSKTRESLWKASHLELWKAKQLCQAHLSPSHLEAMVDSVTLVDPQVTTWLC